MRSSRKRILFLSRDHGSVKTIIPVIQALRDGSQSDIELSAVTPGIARELFLAAGIDAEELSEDAYRTDPARAISTALDAYGPDLIVTGCGPAVGPPPETPEQYATIEAKQRGISVLSILDTWHLYRERFCEYRTGKIAPALVPERLCVLDHRAKAKLLVLGVPEDRMAITHNPALDALARLAHTPPAPPAAMSSDSLNVLFVSQPLAEMAHERGWPFTQRTIFDYLCEALPPAPSRSPHRVVVWIHPRETSVRWSDVATRRADVEKVIVKERGTAFLANADLVVTSHSTVSYEALYFGTPCICVRPGGRSLPRLITEEIGLSRSFFEVDPLKRYLATFDSRASRGALLHKKGELVSKRIFFNDGAATSRVISEIASMLHQD